MEVSIEGWKIVRRPPLKSNNAPREGGALRQRI